MAGKDHVVILTNRFWKKLGADPHIIGKQIMLDQKPYTVVGVLAPGLNRPSGYGSDCSAGH